MILPPASRLVFPGLSNSIWCYKFSSFVFQDFSRLLQSLAVYDVCYLVLNLPAFVVPALSGNDVNDAIIHAWPYISPLLQICLTGRYFGLWCNQGLKELASGKRKKICHKTSHLCANFSSWFLSQKLEILKPKIKLLVSFFYTIHNSVLLYEQFKLKTIFKCKMLV